MPCPPLIYLGGKGIASVAFKQGSGCGFRFKTGFRRGWVKDWVVTCDGEGFEVVAGKLSLALLGFDLPQLSIPESDSTGSSIQAKEVDNDSKELKGKIEALNEELVIERQTRGAAEATLEHLRAEYIEADAKS
ncbi:hypothetical protein Tco_0168445 [Tanacetum coccineum]